MEQNFKIAVPEGCTVNIEKNDNFVIVSLEPNNWEPKNGDIFFREDTKTQFILRKKDGNIAYCYAGINIDGNLVIDNGRNWTKVFNKYRPSTEEEKQLLFDALAKEGKRWNAKEKRIEDLLRWRALYNENYYLIGSELTVDCQSEIGYVVDDSRYNAGNYFKTREAAEKVAKQIREIFKNSKAE